MSISDPLLVDCGVHGKRTSSVVCKHLLLKEPAPLGFIENSSDPNDLQGWCSLCEDLFQREGGMTEGFREFNGMTIVCVVCYTELRARHTPALI